MKPLTIRPPAPHEASLLGLTVLAGVAALVLPPARSRAVDAALPEWVTVVYYSIIVFGGLDSLAGIVRLRRALRRGADLIGPLAMERGGLVLTAPLFVAYAAALASTGNPAGTFPALMALGIAAAHLMRAREITADIRSFRIAVSAGLPADPLDPPLLADPQEDPDG